MSIYVHYDIQGSFPFVGLEANNKECALCPSARGATTSAMQSNNAKGSQRRSKKRASRKTNENGEGAIDERSAVCSSRHVCRTRQ